MFLTHELIIFRNKGPGQLECELDLKKLLPTEDERQKFESKWGTFLASDPNHRDIFRREGSKLVYLSEQLIPAKTDKRPPLLLLLGNPASHSIKAGMFFSFEARGREHRFWKNILRPAGILDLADDENLSIKGRNTKRRECLFQLDYKSPFRIGLAVFFSMPSAASGPWSGVDGIKKLFGKKAMKRLEAAERERILECSKSFLIPDGALVAFQKNAWEGLRSPDDPQYRLDAAKNGRLKGKLSGMPKIPLFCVPPTKLSGPCVTVLKQFSISK
jgi:hypothetical protein